MPSLLSFSYIRQIRGFYLLKVEIHAYSVNTLIKCIGTYKTHVGFFHCLLSFCYFQKTLNLECSTERRPLETDGTKKGIHRNENCKRREGGR